MIQKNLKAFLNNRYSYKTCKKSYNRIIALHNNIDFLMQDFKTTDENFANILLGLEKFINSLCLAELKNRS